MFTVVIKDKLLKYNQALDLYSILDLFSQKTKIATHALKKAWNYGRIKKKT